MNVYILTGIKNEVLECVEVYNILRDALDHAKSLAKKWSVYPQFIGERHVPAMDGFVVVDAAREAMCLYSEPIFITVVERALAEPTHNAIGNAIFGKPIQPPASVPADNPFDPELPGGFTVNDKPLFIKDLKDLNFKYDYQLTEDQKWALVVARVSKRPSFIYPIIGTSYDQLKSLVALKAKNAMGLEIRDVEIAVLANYYWELADEASSSSSEDSYG